MEVEFMISVQITTKDMPVSAALEAHIRKKIQKLSQYYSRITSCRVVVDLPQKHKHQGKLYNVRIDVTVPGKEFVVTKKQNEDVYVALRDAFHALNRQIEEHARKRQGHVKAHHNTMHGHVARLIAEEGYGFINGTDGHEYYFSVTNVGYPDFKQLCIGDAVEYIAQPMSDGRQAHRVLRERHNNHIVAA